MRVNSAVFEGAGMMEREPLVGAADTAIYLGTTRQALYALRHKGEGPPCYRLGRRLLFRLSEVDEWLSHQRDQQQPA